MNRNIVSPVSRRNRHRAKCGSLDTPEYFVRRRYLDFIGREPDEAGFNASGLSVGAMTRADCYGVLGNNRQFRGASGAAGGGNRNR
jgi:hypothetical protein